MQEMLKYQNYSSEIVFDYTINQLKQTNKTNVLVWKINEQNNQKWKLTKV